MGKDFMDQRFSAANLSQKLMLLAPFRAPSPNGRSVSVFKKTLWCHSVQLEGQSSGSSGTDGRPHTPPPPPPPPLWDSTATLPQCHNNTKGFRLKRNKKPKHSSCVLLRRRKRRRRSSALPGNLTPWPSGQQSACMHAPTLGLSQLPNPACQPCMIISN